MKKIKNLETEYPEKNEKVVTDAKSAREIMEVAILSNKKKCIAEMIRYLDEMISTRASRGYDHANLDLLQLEINVHSLLNYSEERLNNCLVAVKDHYDALGYTVEDRGNSQFSLTIRW